MFKNCSVMAIKAQPNNDEILIIELNQHTQDKICHKFSEAYNNLLNDKTKVLFDGSYKPHDDEYLAIDKFTLSDSIMDAIRDPIGVKSFEKIDGIFPEIKAIFVGKRIETKESEQFVIAFQRFRKEQYISNIGINLFLDKNTFVEEKRFGISISNIVDCCYSNGELDFTSYYYAKQIFDLSDYYRTATDIEVKQFSLNEGLEFENSEEFLKKANTWVRRKIAMINDSEVLKNNSVKEINKEAKKIGLDLQITNGKILIPNDKEKIKLILGFLDEEAYKGPFSKKTFLANSKKIV